MIRFPVVVDVPRSVSAEIHIPLRRFDLGDELVPGQKLAYFKVIGMFSNVDEDGIYSFGIVGAVFIAECFESAFGPSDITDLPTHRLRAGSFFTLGPLLGGTCYDASGFVHTKRLAGANVSQRRSDLSSNAIAGNNNFHFPGEICFSERRRFRHTSSNSFVLMIQTTLLFSGKSSQS
jgi:hypothetical protein